MRRHLAGHSKLSGAKLTAADADGNGRVDNVDLALLRVAIAGRVSLPMRIVFGDLDGDGKLTTNDTVIMRRHLAGHSKLSGAKLNAADVDLNGQVDQTDLELLRKAIAGSVKLPSVN